MPVPCNVPVSPLAPPIPMSIERIVLLDGDQTRRERLARMLSSQAASVQAVANLAAAQDAAMRGEAEVLIAHIQSLPATEAELFHGSISGASCPWLLLLAAPEDLPRAASWIERGASDLLLEPFAEVSLELALRRAEDQCRRSAAHRFLNRSEEAGLGSELIGASPALDRLRRSLRQVAPTHAAVLVRGEPGTGKTRVARVLYQQSSRAERPFISVPCGHRPSSAIALDLFGQEIAGGVRRAGACEAAHGGTVLLEEIGDLSPSLQARLLRVLEEQRFERTGSERTRQTDLRIIATTARDLDAKVRRGEFREDLFWALNIVPLFLPPLRERAADIAALAEYFRQKWSWDHGAEILAFSPAALAWLQAQSWPGNVRELELSIEQAVRRCGRGVLEPVHLGCLEGEISVAVTNCAQPDDDSSPEVAESLAEVEKKHIFEMLERCRQNRTQAAQRLGISIRTLRNKLNEYNFKGPPEKGNEETAAA